MTHLPTPLSDLHRHLDGSLRPSTFEELARAHGQEPPPPEALRFQPGMGLHEALSKFAMTLAVLQSTAAVERVAAEICEDARREGVSTLEIRFAPQLHRGAPMADIVDAALAGASGRAGLILCGLYGEPPGLLESMVELAASRPGIVGIDLAGGPSPTHSFTLTDYAAPFIHAAKIGLGRTVHAAEGRSAAEILVAVKLLGATRIGHGTTLLDSPTALDLVLQRRVTMEACPTSNVHTGAIATTAAHPLGRWLDLGVQVCINTDNTLLSSVDAPEEYRRALGISGMSEEKLQQAIAFGHAAAFQR